MKLELELGGAYGRRGSLFLGDDALWNSAFPEVVRSFSSPNQSFGA